LKTYWSARRRRWPGRGADEIFVAIQRLVAEGVTILVVEQNTALALEVADHGYVLEQGHFAIQGPAASLAADPRVKQAYLGI
jgi:branched-chain amino acid transport system ATP-binding protein